MEPTNPQSSGEQRYGQDDNSQQKQERGSGSFRNLGIKASFSTSESAKGASQEGGKSLLQTYGQGTTGREHREATTMFYEDISQSTAFDQGNTQEVPGVPALAPDPISQQKTHEMTPVRAQPASNWMESVNTVEMPSLPRRTGPLLYQAPSGYSNSVVESPIAPIRTSGLHHIPWSLQPPQSRAIPISKGKALFLIALLSIVIVQALNLGPNLFTGSQGWAYVLAGPATDTHTNLLQTVNKKQANKNTHTALTPDQYIDSIIQQMTLDQKLGQMMMVQFQGASYSLDLSTMVDQQEVGGVFFLAGNGNVVSKSQLLGLSQQIQHGTALPLTLAIDQEGGAVDRLGNLNGPSPSEAEIGATNDPAKAQAQGQTDAQNLTEYGITLNLAPVVDVDNSNLSEEHKDYRMYGRDAATVSKMAAGYLQGLQQSGKVLGTLKHFPGLGDTAGDPHTAPPTLPRSKAELEQIDWAPYHTLISQGLVHAIMVTHEFIPSIDPNVPASLSPKIVQNILRDEMGYQGVIMTDSLSMQSISAVYTPQQSAAMAVEAGSDMIMGASTPQEVATMIDGIKQAITTGAISQQRIDQSVHRLLMLKYLVGQIQLPQH